MISLKTLKGCSTRELSGVTSWDGQTIMELMRGRITEVTGWEKTLSTIRQPFILFNDKVKPEDAEVGGQVFANYITEHKLGILHETQERFNWTGNKVKCWLWEVDYDAVRAWYAAHPKQEREKAIPEASADMVATSDGSVNNPRRLAPTVTAHIDPYTEHILRGNEAFMQQIIRSNSRR